jgi:hypothetical protein
MMVVVIWTNLIIGIMLMYAFCKLQSIEKKTFGIKLKILLVVLAVTGIIATFGNHLIYLLTSGLIAYVALAKDKQKGNDNMEVDN